MGFSPGLKTATEMAVRNRIDFLVTEKHLSRDDAWPIAPIAGCINRFLKGHGFIRAAMAA